VKPKFLLFSQARWSNIAYFLKWSEIITTAKLRTVMRNLVQMWKRYLIRSGPNVIQLENGTKDIWDTRSFCWMTPCWM